MAPRFWAPCREVERLYGYVTINRAALTDGQLSRFQACYCGLCHTLRETYGQLSRLTLSYDMTVMALVHSALYEPQDEKSARLRCPTHPIRPRPVCRDGVYGYAAAMSVALAYHKCLDDWHDEHDLPRAGLARALRPAYRRVAERYPDHCAVIEDEARRTAALEKDPGAGLDQLAGCTGRIMGRLYDMDGGFFAPTLRSMGCALGRFVYIMDAWDDLDGDVRHGRPNPLRAMRQRPDLDAEIYDILTLEMAACCEAFERLPIVRDAELLRNVLYAGVWTRWTQRHADSAPRRKGTPK